ncbi:hypothetical protein [Calothrix sp. UHCC 0171]|uniref:hypothetical protein n=1 Tax=Calothrix sp. UHCC 0171 TaxID=3110245 RepID=UPI002B214426|nr:hypothetical protein [Calothrix sp. UHCC 0171]MEA5573012.1 hypothetical protein [Calothrix sp. UHCC 0171]
MCEKHLNILLLAAMQAPPDSLERRKALHRLLVNLQKLPGIAKSSHPDYPIALSNTWQWVCRNIDNFDVGKSSIQDIILEDALVNWINGYLRRRIQDLYLDKDTKILSLDAFNQDDSGNQLSNTLESKLVAPTLSGLDAEIEKERQKYYKKIADEIRLYIERDPDNILQNSHIKGNTQCNCQYLSKRLLLKNNPDSLKTISQELNTPYQTIVTRWSRRCLPLLRETFEKIGYQLI